MQSQKPISPRRLLERLVRHLRPQIIPSLMLSSPASRVPFTVSNSANGEFLVRFGVSHQTTPLSEGPCSISTTPSGSPGSVSKEGGLRKDHDKQDNPIRLVRMVDKIESMVRRL